ALARPSAVAERAGVVPVAPDGLGCRVGCAVPADERASECGCPVVTLCARASSEIPRRLYARRALGLYPAGAPFRSLGLGPARAVLVPAQPAPTLCALLFRRCGDRRVRHRARPARGGRTTGAALGGVARGRLAAVPAVARADGSDDEPAGRARAGGARRSELRAGVL